MLNLSGVGKNIAFKAVTLKTDGDVNTSEALNSAIRTFEQEGGRVTLKDSRPDEKGSKLTYETSNDERFTKALKAEHLGHMIQRKKD